MSQPIRLHPDLPVEGGSLKVMRSEIVLTVDAKYRPSVEVALRMIPVKIATGKIPDWYCDDLSGTIVVTVTHYPEGIL